MAGTPIKITFYNPDDSIKIEYSKIRLPLGLVDVAFDLMEQFDQSEATKETWEKVQAFLVEAFGNQFTLTELKQGADLSEMWAVFEMIAAKIKNVMPGLANQNPTRPGSNPRSRRHTSTKTH